MKIVITGGSGLIGKCLSERLRAKGHAVFFLIRSKFNNPNQKNVSVTEKKLFWENAHELSNADVIVHLAGARISDRWTKKHKQEILRSRTRSTEALILACKAVEHPPKHIVSMSGIGYYSDPCFSPQIETSHHGSGFLAGVCLAWENALHIAHLPSSKISIVRTGLVLSNDSKIINASASQFYICGMVGSVGNKNALWSWIHIHDLCNIFSALIENTIAPGIYNAVAPTPCSQGEFGLAYERFPKKLNTYVLHYWIQNALANLIQRMVHAIGLKWRPTIPGWLLRCFWGEKTVIALTNQNVSAKKLLDTGFCFQYDTIEKSLEHLSKNPTI